jgi:D-alanyl-D-alanine carboxypeptidase
VTRAVVPPSRVLGAAVGAVLLALGTALPARAEPSIQAQAAIVVEPQSGDIVYQRRADERRAIASAT